MLATVFVDGLQVRSQLALDRRVDATLLKAVEECEELVELPLADRVVLVVVTLRAAHGQAQPHRPYRTRAVDSLLKCVLLGIHPSLAIPERVAMESGRDPLVDSRVGQEVTGDLLNREAVEWHGAIDRVDHPAPVPPCMRPRVILGISVRIRVSHLIEPVHRLLLAKVVGGEEPINRALVRAVAPVVKERPLLIHCRDQPCHVER